MVKEIELYETRIDTLYHLGYEDDEYIVKRTELNERISWDVQSITYGDVQSSSKLGKKLINFINKYGK